jgi:lambda repressor-like predicted transcriptional regulator
LHRERIAYELARRGKSQAAFCRAAGIPEETLTRALNGREVLHETVATIANALAAIPVLPLADLIIAPPRGKRQEVAE